MHPPPHFALYFLASIFLITTPLAGTTPTNYTIIPTAFDAEPFTNAPPSIPPACTIQTQVCLPSAGQEYDSHMWFRLPGVINKTACAISYTTSTATREWPPITQIRNPKPGAAGSGIPCGVGAVMEFESPFGSVELVYKTLFGRGGSGGVPGDPWISINSGKTMLEAWNAEQCTSGEYGNADGSLCHYWW
ncbi:hypothetical protein G7Y79_00072g097840 [Physcia stellaris]|nr:hypothetical protein G7Y79_00072g097840 [Physcia stellaris]